MRFRSENRLVGFIPGRFDYSLERDAQFNPDTRNLRWTPHKIRPFASH